MRAAGAGRRERSLSAQASGPPHEPAPPPGLPSLHIHPASSHGVGQHSRPGAPMKLPSCHEPSQTRAPSTSFFNRVTGLRTSSATLDRVGEGCRAPDGPRRASGRDPGAGGVGPFTYLRPKEPRLSARVRARKLCLPEL